MPDSIEHSHATFTKRVERVLLELAESKDTSTADRLAAIAQLISIKQVKAKPKPVKQYRGKRAQPSNVLGSMER